MVDFTDQDLLGVAYTADTDSPAVTTTHIVTFDNILFSRNIFITSADIDVGVSCNYYLELEEVPVGAATLMQLKLGVARKLNLQQD